jgi:hypothetical protein
VGADDRNLPIPGPIREHMLDDRRDFPLLGGITRVLHLTEAAIPPKISARIYAPQSTRNPREISSWRVTQVIV